MRKGSFHTEPSEINSNCEWILGYEPYFNKKVWVGSINHETKEVRHCHGYYPGHRQGYRVRLIAKKLGYKTIKH
jgi:hypothetical protein